MKFSVKDFFCKCKQENSEINEFENLLFKHITR